MTYGYKEILNDMVSCYENETGEELWEHSETYKRLEAVASELYAISCFANRNLQQSLVQSATGKYLDMHAALRGIERKKANPATGTLTFMLDEPAEQEIEIPKATVCSVKDNPYLQFKTTNHNVIPVGEISAVCEAQAIESGGRYNVKSGEVTVMVNAPIGISSVINESEFSGGKDTESDSHLRKRIMSHYGVIQNGVNNISLENMVLSLDFVRDCHVPDAYEFGFITVYVLTNDDKLGSERVEKIVKTLELNSTFGAEIEVKCVKPSYFTMSVEIHLKSGYQNDGIEQSVYDMINDFCLGTRIGRPIEFNEIANLLAKNEAIKHFRISSPQAIGEAIYCNAEKYLFLNGLAVEVIE